MYCFILADLTLAAAFDDTPVLVRTANSDASDHIVGLLGTQTFVAIGAQMPGMGEVREKGVLAPGGCIDPVNTFR